MKNFEFKNSQYRLIDFDNEFTFEQGEFGKQIYTDIVGNLQNVQIDANNIAIMINSLNINDILRILALIYIKDNGEPTEQMYLENLETFKRLPAKKIKEMDGALKSFFTFITQFLMDVLRGFSQASIATKQTQKR